MFLVPWPGTFLCRLQDTFQWVEALGLLILISGVLVYNNVMHLNYEDTKDAQLRYEDTKDAQLRYEDIKDAKLRKI